MAKLLIILSTLAICSLAQRSNYLRRPVGYPEIATTTRAPTTTQQQQSDIGLREIRIDDAEDETDPYIPTEFRSDPLSFYYYMGLPMNQRPFNVLNAPQIQDWNSRPHTYTLNHNNYARQ